MKWFYEYEIIIYDCILPISRHCSRHEFIVKVAGLLLAWAPSRYIGTIFF